MNKDLTEVWTMSKFKVGDVGRWYLNPREYIAGVVVEEGGDGTVWVEYNNRQQLHYHESEMALHDSET